MKSISKRLSWLLAAVCAVALVSCSAAMAWAEEAADYFTLYVKDPATGVVTPCKAYSQEEFAALSSPVTASAMNGLTQVYTTNNAVTFEDLFADAGVVVEDQDLVFAAADYGTEGEFGLGGSWTWADMKAGQFYPNATSSEYAAADAVATVPCLGLNNATAKNYTGTAGQAESDNLEVLASASETGSASAPRLFLGIAAEKFNADYASDKVVQGGKRCISNVNALVITQRTADEPKAAANLVYSGSVQQGVSEGKGFTVENAAGANAGAYSATCKLADGYVWADGTTDDRVVSWSIAKASQKISGKTTVTKTYKAAKKGKYAKKISSAKTVKAPSVFALKAKGALTYKVSSVSPKAKKCVSVSKSGKVTIKKGLGKGTFTIKIKASASETSNYKAASKTITLKVKVK